MQIDTRKLKKLIIKAVPYVAFSYVGNLIGFAYRTAEGNGFQEKILPFMSNLGVAFARIFPSLHPFDLLFGLGLAGVMRLVLYVKSKNKKKFRQGEEYGSAVWGGEKDIEPYMDLSCPENNVILTKTESLTMGKPSAPKFARNKNILVIGGSGSGKTRFFVKPNLMQMHSSYVVTDPKGTVLVECGKMLERAARNELTEKLCTAGTIRETISKTKMADISLSMSLTRSRCSTRSTLRKVCTTIRLLTSQRKTVRRTFSNSLRCLSKTLLHLSSRPAMIFG